MHGSPNAAARFAAARLALAQGGDVLYIGEHHNNRTRTLGGS